MQVPARYHRDPKCVFVDEFNHIEVMRVASTLQAIFTLSISLAGQAWLNANARSASELSDTGNKWQVCKNRRGCCGR